MRKMIGYIRQSELIDQLPRAALAARRRAGQARGEHDVLGPAQLFDEVK